ncbi:MAG: hypothetical protein R3236_00200 [Phycisphaeraceae bacterium]|nr:hypothetical protein [Phycisphaeraceae bacterium]
MFEITPEAGQHLTQMLQNADAGENQSIRLVPTQEGLAPKLDEPKPDDASFEHAGQTVLVLSPQVNEALSSKKLDAKKEGAEQPQLMLVDA